ncbi:MAG: PPOX class F420-dependent oxidoreductase [Solirubrobacterales bacterium]
MTDAIPDQARHLFTEPNLGFVSTLRPDGSPHTTAIWVDLEGAAPVLNTLQGRVKHRNLQRDPRIAIAVADRDNPYESISVNGTVTEMTSEGAAEHLDRLAQKYLSEERYPYSEPGDVRLILRVGLERVHYFNPGAD